MQHILLLALCFVAGFVIVHQLWNAGRAWFKIGVQKRRASPFGRHAEALVHYRRVLGVGSEANSEVLRATYLSLVEKYDSSTFAYLGPEFVDLALNRTKEVLEAYQFLSRSASSHAAPDDRRSMKIAEGTE